MAGAHLFELSLVIRVELAQVGVFDLDLLGDLLHRHARQDTGSLKRSLQTVAGALIQFAALAFLGQHQNANQVVAKLLPPGAAHHGSGLLGKRFGQLIELRGGQFDISHGEHHAVGWNHRHPSIRRILDGKLHLGLGHGCLDLSRSRLRGRGRRLGAQTSGKPKTQQNVETFHRIHPNKLGLPATRDWRHGCRTVLGRHGGRGAYSAGSITADIEPWDRGSRGSGP